MLLCSELVNSVMNTLSQFSGRDITSELLEEVSQVGSDITHQYFPDKVSVKAVVLPENLSQVRIYFTDDTDDSILSLEQLDELFLEYWMSNTTNPLDD